MSDYDETGEELFPPEVKQKWICGHTASAVCGQCYASLVATAKNLAEENLLLRDQIGRLGGLWSDIE